MGCQRAQVHVQVFFTSVDGQVQPLDVAVLQSGSWIELLVELVVLVSGEPVPMRDDWCPLLRAKVMG
jgi:hypothetical protein